MFPDKSYEVRGIVVVKVGDRNVFSDKVIQTTTLEEVKEFSRQTRRTVEVYDNGLHLGWLRVDLVKGKEKVQMGPCTAHKGRGETECVCLLGK